MRGLWLPQQVAARAKNILGIPLRDLTIEHTIVTVGVVGSRRCESDALRQIMPRRSPEATVPEEFRGRFRDSGLVEFTWSRHTTPNGNFACALPK